MKATKPLGLVGNKSEYFMNEIELRGKIAKRFT